jgi:hypothetical protein
VSHDLAVQIRAELEELDSLLEKNRILLQAPAPNLIEIQAIAAVLHSFYTGLENSFKRIGQQYKLSLDRENWHSSLLRAMRDPLPDGRTVINSETYSELKGYLRFRHVFRQGYSTSLEWSKMAPLAGQVDQAYGRVRGQLARFVETI